MIRTCLFGTLRFFVSTYRMLKTNCNCFRAKSGIVVQQEDTSDIPSLIMYKVVRTRDNGDTDLKYKLEWHDELPNTTTHAQLFEHVMPPWLLICNNGDDLTEQLHPYIAKGNKIHINFLNWKFGKGKWTILDTKTFEEVNFPSSGITIR